MAPAAWLNLPYMFCYFLDPPLPNQPLYVSDCTLSSDNTSEYCIACPVNASFHTGGSVVDTSSTGQKFSVFIWILILVFGLFGILTNSLIILILRKQQTSKSFEVLLAALAYFDLLCSVMAVLVSSGIISFFQNWGRSYNHLYWIYLTYFTTALGRTGSTFMKVLITAERYIFIACPHASTMWLTKMKTRILAFGVFLFSVILNLPRYLSVKVETLDGPFAPYAHIHRLSEQGLGFIMRNSELSEQRWFEVVQKITFYIDLWGPFPLLILFTILIFYEISKINSKKQELQVIRKKDIREVQMFVPVIIILFFCNILPVAHFMFMEVSGEIYREQVLGIFLFLAVCSALNLPVYILRGCTFRKEARAFLFKITNRIGSSSATV